MNRFGKKFGMMLLSMACAAAVAFVAPSTVKAEGMPCTEAELVKAEAQLANAYQTVAACQAAKDQAEANYNMVKNSGASELEKLVASDDLTNKINQLAYANYLVEEANRYIANVKSRAFSEQYELDMRVKWAGRADHDTLIQDAINKQDIANTALAMLNNLKGALAVQEAAAATNPGLTDVVNSLKAQVAQAEVDYANKKAAADAAIAAKTLGDTTINYATNGDQGAYETYVKACIDATKDPKATAHDIMCWYD